MTSRVVKYQNELLHLFHSKEVETMKKVGLFIFVAALAMLVGAMPAFAGKQALSESDLDQITAAGQPEVLITSTVVFSGGATGTTFADGGPITKTVNQDVEFIPAGSSQSNLRALTLNNVLGENSVATAMNIAATSTASTSQRNTIEQSWGSTLDVASVGGATGSIDISGVCVACVNTAGAGGSGGTVDVSGKAVASTSTVGSGGGKTLSIYSDQILIGGGPITVNQLSTFDLLLSGGVQTGLAALVVNNVVAMNLVASALNINSGAISLATDPAITAVGASTGVQYNQIDQNRGTPLRRP